MFVMHDGNQYICNSVDEINEIINKKDEKGTNTVYMRPEKSKAWPLMSILILDNMAFVEIGLRDFDKAYISLADFTLDLDYENGKTIFYEGERPVEVQNLYVISTDTLYEVVAEFFQTGKMPECIMWT